jgi:hypothetical protein
MIEQTDKPLATAESSAHKGAVPVLPNNVHGRISLPSEDEIRGLFVSVYREDDPRCAILVRQIIECHRAKISSPERLKIIGAIKAGKEWRRIAPTWEKFARRALARSVLAKSHAPGRLLNARPYRPGENRGRASSGNLKRQADLLPSRRHDHPPAPPDPKEPSVYLPP